MTDISEVEAERIGRWRARMFAAQAVLFISWQGTFFVTPLQEPLRTVDAVKLAAWLVWVAALLLLLATGGSLFRGRGLRALLNDEFTRRNRAQAYVAGVWAAVISAVGLYLIDLFDVVATREAIHFILSAAIASALITFAVLERRSLRSD